MLDQELPCIVELFGHQRIAGKVSEQTVGGSAFIRVDVPKVDDQPAFTKFYGAGAIYAITPTDEATMLQAVKAFRSAPIDRYQLMIPEKVIPLPRSGDPDYDDDFYGDFEDDDE